MNGVPDDLKQRVLIGILVLAAVVRIICFFGQPLVGADSPRFLRAAEAIERGDVYSAFRDDYHPLAAFCFATANRVQIALLGRPESAQAARIGRERAAYTVSVVFGLLLVVILVALTRRLFSGLSPELVGLFAALHPYLVRQSADVMSDSIFLTLFFLAIHEAVRMVETPRLLTLLSSGGAIGLAYLARPEALILLPGLIGYWTWHRWRQPGLVGAWSIGLLIACALLVFPYMLALYFDVGVWTLSRKKSIIDLMGFGGTRQAGIGAVLLDFRAWWRVFTRWYFASPEVLAITSFFGLGYVLKNRTWSPGHTLFALLAFALASLLALVEHGGGPGYVTKRHALCLATLTLPFATQGIQSLANFLRSRLPAKWSPHALAILVVAGSITLAVKAVAPQRQNQVGLVAAAEYILEQAGPGANIFAVRGKVPYYCSGVFRKSDSGIAGTRHEMSKVRNGYVVFYRDKNPEFANLVKEGLAGGSLEHLQTFEPRHVQVYLWTRD